MKRSWKEWKLHILDFNYKANAEKWKNEHDDRKLFSNMYYYMRAAVETLDEEPHNFVCVAMNRRINEDREIMDRILERFER